MFKQNVWLLQNMQKELQRPEHKLPVLRNIFSSKFQLEDYPQLRSVTKQDFAVAWQGHGLKTFMDDLQKISPITNAHNLNEILLFFLREKMSFPDIIAIQDTDMWNVFSKNLLSVDDKLLGKSLARILLEKFSDKSLAKREDFYALKVPYINRFSELYTLIVNELHLSDPIQRYTAIFVFCLNEGLLQNSWVITMFMRMMFLFLETELHHFNADQAALVMQKIHSCLQTYVDPNVSNKMYICNFFLRQSESWQVESTMCDIFKLIVTFIPTSPEQIATLGYAGENQITKNIHSLLKTMTEVYPLKYMCLLQGLLRNIYTLFYQDVLINKPVSNQQVQVDFEKQINVSRLVKRRLNFVANQSWYDIYRSIQDSSAVDNRKGVAVNEDQLIKQVEQRILQGQLLSQKELKVYQDHITMLKLIQKYSHEKLQSHSTDQEFIFLQQHIRSHFYPYYIPYFQPEYVQQVMNRYRVAIEIIDEFMSEVAFSEHQTLCHKYMKELKIPVTPFKHHCTLYQLLPVFDTVDFDLYDIEGDDMWTQAHFTQQGLNQIFSFVSAEVKHAEPTSVNQEDMFNLSRTWCKHAYRDYKKICQQVKTCSSKLSSEQNQQLLRVTRVCINKRELYQHTCTYHVDQGHTDQIKWRKIV